MEVENDRVCVLECNLDDMTGEELAYALDRLLAAGALDAWHTPIYMKKGRPAVLLSVICRPEDRDALCLMMLRETTTLGVRWREAERRIADRRTEEVMTRWGRVRCKVKRIGGVDVAVKPEYEDCAELAERHHLPFRQVADEALRIFGELTQRGA